MSFYYFSIASIWDTIRLHNFIPSHHHHHRPLSWFTVQQKICHICVRVSVCVYLVDLGWVVLILLSCKSCLCRILLNWRSGWVKKQRKELLINLTRTEGKYFQCFVCKLQNYLDDDFHPAPNVAVATCTVYLLSSSATSCSCSCETGVAGMPKPGGDLTQGQAQQCCLVESTGDSWWSTAWVDGMIWNGSK